MAFNDAVKTMGTGGERFGVFLPNVKVKYFSGDGATVFRIAPAHQYMLTADNKFLLDDQGNKVPNGPVAFDPFRWPNGDLTEWGNVLQIARSIGHGRDFKSGARKDILSPKTFDSEAFCPLSHLHQVASAYPEWQYLIEDKKDHDGKVLERAALPRVGRLMIMNIVDVGDPKISNNVVIGCVTKSAADSLFAQNGVAVAPGMAPPEFLAQNYLYKWAYGDITDPTNGPLLTCMRQAGKGNFSSYYITVATDSQGNVRRWPLNEHYLQQRYELANLTKIVAQETDQAIIGQLCQLLGMRSPQGRHEWYLLKEAFGHMANIPNPPENAPAATSTVAGGFQSPPPPPGFGAPAQPQQPAWQPPPMQQPAPQQTAPQQPTWQPPPMQQPAPQQATAPAPAYQPPPQYVAPPMQPAYVPPPVQPPAAPQATVPAAVGAVMQNAGQPSSVPPMQQASPPQPGVGDPNSVVPGTGGRTRAQFLESLKKSPAAGA